jgi:hypothetical protein
VDAHIKGEFVNPNESSPLEIPGQNENIKDSGRVASHSGDGASSTPALESDSRLTIHKATGPRTPVGKEESKHNATKHGIFSKVVLLKSECDLSLIRC